ncbi:MAG: 50S ribosomal protein L13 [Bacilli bacterium]|jgi:large subunit ribosomal protein L13|nr:50S ribosomal protein L13 [Bacilli bacterium]
MQRQTTMAKPAEVKRAWYLVDATDIPLGRLASQVAQILMGKNKAIYTPNQDTGDFVIVINASKVKMTGKNGGEHKKNYYNVSEYAGGLRTRTAGVMLREFPEELIKRCVWGMLPKGPLGRKMLKKLFVYKDEKHEQEAQKPVKLELKK